MRPYILLFAFISQAWAEAELPKPVAQPVAKAPSAAAGGSAARVDDPAAARELFRQLDRNGDGYLTGDELWSLRGQEANWAAVDRNRDGRISPDEFTVLRRR